MDMDGYGWIWNDMEKEVKVILNALSLLIWGTACIIKAQWLVAKVVQLGASPSVVSVRRGRDVMGYCTRPYFENI
jgi:hypothetical protein